MIHMLIYFIFILIPRVGILKEQKEQQKSDLNNLEDLRSTLGERTEGLAVECEDCKEKQEELLRRLVLPLYGRGGKISTHPLVITSEIYKGRVILLKALVLQDECFGKNYLMKSYYSLVFFTAYAFIGQLHVFAGQVNIVSHLSFITNIFVPCTPPTNFMRNPIQVTYSLY